MDRRTFVRNSLATLGGSTFGAGLGIHRVMAMGGGNYAGQPPIKYFRDTVPAFTIPPYQGQRYGDEIPDTLDIASRDELGVRVRL